MEKLEKELKDFLKYIMDVHTDSYGMLEVCDTGDEHDPTIEKVVKGYLKYKTQDISIESFLSETAKNKLNFINGSCISRDFPNVRPSLEWTGAVLDLINELKLDKLILK